MLILSLLGTEDADSPLVCVTGSTTSETNCPSGACVYPPGRHCLPDTEGAFLGGSFCLVQALALTGRREAVELFEALLDRADPLGLHGCEMDPQREPNSALSHGS